MAPSSAIINASVMGTIIGTLLGEGARRTLSAYDKAFTKDKVQTAFMIAFAASVLTQVVGLLMGAMTIHGFLSGIVVGTLVGGATITVARTTWYIVSDAAKGVYETAKAGVQSAWLAIRVKLFGSASYEGPDPKRDAARENLRAAR